MDSRCANPEERNSPRKGGGAWSNNVEIAKTAFIAVYATSLCSYFFTETSENFRARAVNKILLSTLFLSYAVAAFVLHYAFRSYHLVLLVAVFLAWLGDVFLLWDLNRGGDFFLCSNLCFLVYGLAFLDDAGIPFGAVWWFLPLAVVLWGSVFVVSGRHRTDIAATRLPMLLYFATVTLHASLGLALAVNAGRASVPAAKVLCFGGGLVLFLVSDCFLVLRKFGYPKSKALARLTSGAYFVGLLGVVFSMSI